MPVTRPVVVEMPRTRWPDGGSEQQVLGAKRFYDGLAHLGRKPVAEHHLLRAVLLDASHEVLSREGAHRHALLRHDGQPWIDREIRSNGKHGDVGEDHPRLRGPHPHR